METEIMVRVSLGEDEEFPASELEDLTDTEITYGKLRRRVNEINENYSRT